MKRGLGKNEAKDEFGEDEEGKEFIREVMYEVVMVKDT